MNSSFWLRWGEQWRLAIHIILMPVSPALDVAGDQQAVDLIRKSLTLKKPAKTLLSYALNRSTTDNVTVLIVRFKKEAERNESNPGINISQPTLSRIPQLQQITNVLKTITLHHLNLSQFVNS